MTRDLDDQQALDALALYLGEQDSWNGGDVCDVLAEIIAATGRPHPGEPVERVDDEDNGYRRAFEAYRAERRQQLEPPPAGATTPR